MAQGQKGIKSQDSHHPNLSNFFLKAPQSVLVAPSLGVSLKGNGADPLRNWGRTTEVMSLPSELRGEGRGTQEKAAGQKAPWLRRWIQGRRPSEAQWELHVHLR